MAQNRPNKPSVTLPDNFGGVKNEFSSTRISTGYESSTPEIVEGGNLNYMLDGLFRNTKYMRTVLDYVRDTPVGKMFWVNQNGQMDYIEPAVIATDTEFNTGTATDKTPNVKQVVDKLATKANNNAVVHLTGDETITGFKTFKNDIFLGGVAGSGQEGGQINFNAGESETNQNVFNFDRNGGEFRFFGVGLDGNVHVPFRISINNNLVYANPSDVSNTVVTTTGISKSENGFVKLGNGIIIQWGRYPSYVSPDPQRVTFPTPFTSTNYKAVCTYFRTGGDVDSGKDHINVDTQSTTGFTFRMSDTTAYGVNWIAIGY